MNDTECRAWREESEAQRLCQICTSQRANHDILTWAGYHGYRECKKISSWQRPNTRKKNAIYLYSTIEPSSISPPKQQSLHFEGVTIRISVKVSNFMDYALGEHMTQIYPCNIKYKATHTKWNVSSPQCSINGLNERGCLLECYTFRLHYFPHYFSILSFFRWATGYPSKKLHFA